MKNIIIGILFILVIILGAWLLFYNKAEAPADEVLNNGNIVPTSPTAPTGPATTTSPQSGEGLIRVLVPVPNQIVASPLTVSGEARGGWYFEASAPIKILDANGKMLGESYVMAQGEWMTENFVPFTGTIRFANSTTATGTIVFSNDNPSGLPENQKTYSVPITFSQ